MTKVSAEVKNPKGIHVRPSGIIFKAIMGYTGVITVTKDGVDTILRDLITLLTLGLHKGSLIEISVDGDNEEKMAANLQQLFEKTYEFEEQ